MPGGPASPPAVPELPVDSLVGAGAVQTIVLLHDVGHAPLDKAVVAAHGPGPENEEGLVLMIVLMLVLKQVLVFCPAKGRTKRGYGIHPSVLH